MVNILVFILLIFSTQIIFAQENDPYAEIADIIASQKTPMDECNDYVNQKGWEQFVPINVNKKILVICGSSTINEPPSSKNF